MLHLEAVLHCENWGKDASYYIRFVLSIKFLVYGENCKSICNRVHGLLNFIRVGAQALMKYK